MSILSKSTKAVTVLSLGFLSTQVLAQDFCNATHSGTKVDVSNTAPTGDANGKGSIGTIGDYSYEEWNKTGTGKATFYSDGSFSCSFENIDDYLCRSGVLYGKSRGVNF
jgi:endo-1,4-beta-xylanase